MTDCGLLATLEFSSLLAPQQTGVQVTEICAGILLMLALLHLLVGWMRRACASPHSSPWLRASLRG